MYRMRIANALRRGLALSLTLARAIAAKGYCSLSGRANFFLGIVEQLYRMRDRGVPAALRKLNRMRDCAALMIFKKSRDRFAAFSQRSAACSS